MRLTELHDTRRWIVEALRDPNFMSNRSFNLPVWLNKRLITVLFMPILTNFFWKVVSFWSQINQLIKWVSDNTSSCFNFNMIAMYMRSSLWTQLSHEQGSIVPNCYSVGLEPQMEKYVTTQRHCALYFEQAHNKCSMHAHLLCKVLW